jgi:hypothetical protein
VALVVVILEFQLLLQAVAEAVETVERQAELLVALAQQI